MVTAVRSLIRQRLDQRSRIDNEHRGRYLVAAGLIPAHRASRLNPLLALRRE